MTIQDLLTEPRGREELTESLDNAMFLMVMLLQHEQEYLETVLKTYEQLYILRQSLQNENPKSKIPNHKS